MAERSGFYNAVLQSDGSYDRVYQAEDFSDCLNLFIPTGIYVTEEESEHETIDKTTVEGLKPYGSGTSLMIKQGKAFIKGQWYVIDEQDLEIPLTINTTKVIVLMHTVVDRETKVQLIDYVNDEIVVPQNDAQFGILLGTVDYTASGLLVTDLREDFMNNSPKYMKVLNDNTKQLLSEAQNVLTDLKNQISNIKKETLLSTYPVGSIYVSIKNTNPNSLFGGTWVSWGSGRVPVGVNTSDSNFNTVEKIGGEKTHTLIQKELPASLSFKTNDIGFLVYGEGTAEGEEVGTPFGSNTTLNLTNIGGGRAHNNLQPYITCYMWKRTA